MDIWIWIRWRVLGIIPYCHRMQVGIIWVHFSREDGENRGLLKEVTLIPLGLTLSRSFEEDCLYGQSTNQYPPYL